LTFSKMNSCIVIYGKQKLRKTRLKQFMNLTPSQNFLVSTSRKQFFQSILLPVGIFILFVFVFFLNSGHLWDVVSQKQDVIFGSDTMDTLDNLRELTFEVDTKKRMLFSITITHISKVIQILSGLSINKSIRLSLAMMAALNITGVYLFLKKYSSCTPEALLFTGFYSIFFSNFVIFSIPETYSVSNLFILLYASSFFLLRKSLTIYRCAILSVIIGVTSLYNPVLLSLAIIPIIMMLFQSDRKSLLIISISNLVFGVVFYFFANYLFLKENPFIVLNYYANYFASINNLMDLKLITDVFSNFYFFSILSPHYYLTSSLELVDWLGYGNSFIGIVSIFMIGSFLIYGVYILFARKNQKDAFPQSLFLWSVLLTLFYTYFNPHEAILYSSQILFPMVIVYLNAFKTLDWRLPIKYAIFSCFLLIVTYINVTALLNGIQ